MAEYVRRGKMPKTFKIAATGDWHLGSRACHEAGIREVINRVKADKKMYMIHMGDLVEGKLIDSPHFNPDSLKSRLLKPGDQFEYGREMLDPIKRSILAMIPGNHDEYLARNLDALYHMVLKPLGLPYTGYQTWLDLGFLRFHLFHGHSGLPVRNICPISLEASQRKKLVSLLAPLAGDVHCHLMGHVHKLVVQPPLERYGLLKDGDNVRARSFVAPEQTVVTTDPITGERHENTYIPPESRWFGCTGTFRRSGGFGHPDYAETAGFPPSAIGYLEITVEKGKIVSIEKVIV
jgi:hypothetical protein